MRCLTCGEEMVLAEAMPAEGEVQGFENQTHHCPACGATERRFMFVGGKTTFVAGRAETATLASAPHRMNVKLSRGVNGADKTAVNQPSGIKLFTVPAKQKSSAGHNGSTAFVGDVTKTKALTSEPPLAQEVRAPNGSNTSGQAWVRAVEKFRSYEADLYRRAENTKKTNGIIEASKASDRLTVPRQDETRAANKPQKTPVGERLRIRAFRNGRYSPPLSHSNGSQPDPEAVRRFDEFWDSLVPAPNGQKPELSVPAASLAPLPQSLSLVVIEPRNVPRSRVGGKYVFKKMLEKVLQCLEGAQQDGGAAYKPLTASSRSSIIYREPLIGVPARKRREKEFPYQRIRLGEVSKARRSAAVPGARWQGHAEQLEKPSSSQITGARERPTPRRFILTRTSINEAC